MSNKYIDHIAQDFKEKLSGLIFLAVLGACGYALYLGGHFSIIGSAIAAIYLLFGWIGRRISKSIERNGAGVINFTFLNIISFIRGVLKLLLFVVVPFYVLQFIFNIMASFDSTHEFAKQFNDALLVTGQYVDTIWKNTFFLAFVFLVIISSAFLYIWMPNFSAGQKFLKRAKNIALVANVAIFATSLTFSTSLIADKFLAQFYKHANASIEENVDAIRYSILSLASIDYVIRSNEATEKLALLIATGLTVSITQQISLESVEKYYIERASSLPNRPLNVDSIVSNAARNLSYKEFSNLFDGELAFGDAKQVNDTLEQIRSKRWGLERKLREKKKAVSDLVAEGVSTMISDVPSYVIRNQVDAIIEAMALSSVEVLSAADKRKLAGLFVAAKINLSDIPSDRYSSPFEPHEVAFILDEISSEDLPAIERIEIELAEIKAAQLAESKTFGARMGRALKRTGRAIGRAL